MSLLVKPISANIVKGREHLFFKIDPYVICQVGTQKRQSQPHKSGGKEPQWTDNFTFDPSSQSMRVVLMDKDTFSRDDIIGEGEVSLMGAYTYPQKAQN